MIYIYGLLIGIVSLVILAWVGLKVKPKSLDPFPTPAGELKFIPLPGNLPEPVDRFYRVVYGNQLPVIQSAVISGKAQMSMNGLTFPARFRFTHQAGVDYRHYIEATIFGLPVMKVNEHYLDGHSRLELPFGVVENEPNVDQAANLGLWAESIWLPSIFITDSRIRWEPIDSSTACLVVPFVNAEERFIVRFDPATGLITLMEAMRYKEPDDQTKTLWINQALVWGPMNATPTAMVGSVTWLDEGKPWAVFNVEEIVLNTIVDEYVRAKGI